MDPAHLTGDASKDVARSLLETDTSGAKRPAKRARLESVVPMAENAARARTRASAVRLPAWVAGMVLRGPNQGTVRGRLGDSGDGSGEPVAGAMLTAAMEPGAAARGVF